MEDNDSTCKFDNVLSIWYRDSMDEIKNNDIVKIPTMTANFDTRFKFGMVLTMRKKTLWFVPFKGQDTAAYAVWFPSAAFEKTTKDDYLIYLLES